MQNIVKLALWLCREWWKCQNRNTLKNKRMERHTTDTMLLYYFTLMWAKIQCFFLQNATYLALSTRSSSSGTSRWTKIPRFIFAGSRAQLDIPIKETFKKIETTINGQKNWVKTSWRHSHSAHFNIFRYSGFSFDPQRNLAFERDRVSIDKGIHKIADLHYFKSFPVIFVDISINEKHIFLLLFHFYTLKIANIRFIPS